MSKIPKIYCKRLKMYFDSFMAPQFNTKNGIYCNAKIETRRLYSPNCQQIQSRRRQ